jgi:hypothetical protein
MIHSIMTEPVEITFVDVTEAEGNKLAGSLLSSLREIDRNISVERHKTKSESQDYGSILALVLGSAAVGSVAKGIAQWIARHAGTTIRIRSADGTSVDIKNATGQDTAEIVQAALQKR